MSDLNRPDQQCPFGKHSFGPVTGIPSIRIYRHKTCAPLLSSTNQWRFEASMASNNSEQKDFHQSGKNITGLQNQHDFSIQCGTYGFDLSRNRVYS